MTGEWEFSKPTGRCAVTDREFAEGSAYYAVLCDTPQGFERRDYSEEAWTGPPEGSFCYWRGRVPTRERKKSAVAIDHEVLTQLFLQLEDDEAETRQQFRFVLALLLMRKRILRYEQTLRNEGQEVWQMRLVKEQSIHRVVNPRLTEERVNRLSAQLSAILSGEVDAIESLSQAEAHGALSPAQEMQTQQAANDEPDGLRQVAADARPSDSESEDEVASP